MTLIEQLANLAQPFGPLPVCLAAFLAVVVGAAVASRWVQA